MPDHFVFVDEAGDFSFTRQPNVSRYFLLCTITAPSCEVGLELLALRRRLAWEGVPLGEFFHATQDKQRVRDAVYSVLRNHDFRIQATILEKSKAKPGLRSARPVLYRSLYHHHLLHGVLPFTPAQSRTLLTTASIGTRRERATFEAAVDTVMRRATRGREWRADFLPSQSDPCLQVADYCAWAIQRKWEREDARSYRLIEPMLDYERELWRDRTTHYY